MSLRFVALLFVVLIQASCGTMEPIPGDTFYRLKQDSSPNPSSSTAPWTSNTLVVERFRANGIYKDRAIAMLQQDEVSLTQSKYHYWNDSPEILLQERFLEFARSHKLATHVALDTSNNADYVVTGRILRFERVKSGDASYEVSIHLELGVRRASGGRELVFRDDFTFQEAVPGEQIPDAVALFSRGTEQLFSQFVSKVGTVISHLPQ